MNEADRLILRQICVHCESIERRINDFSIDERSFMDNDAFFDMLLMPVFQIGELAGALSREFVDKDEMPWQAIRGFRNVIAHDYGVVDPLWAWNTIQADIPALHDHLERVAG